MSKKKESAPSKKVVHEELEGFSIYINEFGQLVSTLPPEALNAFLNKHTDDKKLQGRTTDPTDSKPSNVG